MPTKERVKKDSLRDAKKTATELFKACQAEPDSVNSCGAWLKQCQLVRELELERLHMELETNTKAKAESQEKLAQLQREVVAEEQRQHPLEVRGNELAIEKKVLEEERDSGLRSREFASLDDFEAALESGAIEIGLDIGKRFIADKGNSFVRRECVEGAQPEIVTPQEFLVLFNRQGEIVDWRIFTVKTSQGSIVEHDARHLYQEAENLLLMAAYEETGERSGRGYRHKKA